MMNTILRALRSPGAMMIALVGILAAQGEHTAQVIEFFSHSGGVALAYAFAGAIEVAVLLFVLNGHKRISYGFAVATFFTNVIYYAIGGIELMSIAILPVLLLSILPPAAIVGYSHTIAGTLHTEPQTDDKPATVSRWQFWRKPAEAATTNVLPIEPIQTPVARPGAILGHSSDVAKTAQPAVNVDLPATPAEQPQDVPTVDKRTQALQLHSEGYTPAEIHRMTGAKYSTVQSWLRRSNAQTNGVHQ